MNSEISECVFGWHLKTQSGVRFVLISMHKTEKLDFQVFNSSICNCSTNWAFGNDVVAEGQKGTSELLVLHSTIAVY